jgi:ABC-type lipoprotein release transport system permease subunit
MGRGEGHVRLYLRLAWRNIWRHRRRTLIVVLAIGLTTMLLVFYQGLLAGFDQAIYGNAIKVLGGNVQVHAPGYNAHTDKYPMLPLEDDQAVVESALDAPQVLAATRRINTGGMASNRKGAFAISIVGIEPEAELSASLVGQRIGQGRYLQADDGDVVLIGQGLADAMEIGVGDRFTLVGRATHNQMRQRTMTVIGIYDLGMAEIEKGAVYVSLAEAQTLYLAPGQSTEVVLWLRELGQEAAVMRALAPSMSAYEVTSWKTNFPELTQTMATKGAVMDVFGVIMLAITGIGTLNLMLMAVYERTREIGVLAALGLKPGQISWLFLLEGIMMGIIGALFGLGLGLAINALLGQVGFDFGQFTDMTDYMALIDGRIYPTLGIEKAPRYVLTAVVISILASFYPARQAAHREPAVALHYV